MNQLHGLKKFSVIVADSSDLNTIRRYKPNHATTNPSIILKSPLFTEYRESLKNAITYAKQQSGNKRDQIINASDKLIVNIGVKILANIPGNISTEIDARLSFDVNAIILKAHKLIKMYQEQNINSSRVLIKIAATWEGIQAATELSKNGIKCNLTLLFSFAQAKACAEANVHLISPFVGRIYDWYYQNNLLNQYNINNDPGVKFLKKIFYYYKKYNYNTIIMGASFRTVDQILALSGCDYLTISPKLLEKLSVNTQLVERCLFPPIITKQSDRPIPLSKSDFLQEHNQNKMAVEKLDEGIHKFSLDQQHLENILSEQLQY